MASNWFGKTLEGIHFFLLSLFSKQQHPVSWQPSHDGSRLVGHMILQKSLKDSSIVGGLGGSGGVHLAPSSSCATILGLKVIGGKILPGNRIGAVIEKVKKGSIADTVGRLLPGNYK